jgi:hypothetical protein
MAKKAKVQLSPFEEAYKESKDKSGYEKFIRSNYESLMNRIYPKGRAKRPARKREIEALATLWKTCLWCTSSDVAKNLKAMMEEGRIIIEDEKMLTEDYWRGA